MFLPTYVRNDLLVQTLSGYGKVLEITHAKYRCTPTVKTGTRSVRIKMKESNPVPNFLFIGGHRATFDYAGIKRVCRRCRLKGQIRVNCTTEHRDRCAVLEHATDDCTFDCRRIGGCHSAVDCVARRSYIAGTDSSDFPAFFAPYELELSGGPPSPVPLPDAAGQTPPETQSVAPALGLSAADKYTQWSEGTEDSEVSRDTSMTEGSKDSTNSSDPPDPSDITDPSDNSDLTSTRRGQAQDA
ncbi:hypothetical protein HPB47_001084 [Ixodes persulcatus]|uniref:Uncharacterized protein n=1 Tax=Ixodes persulcatus TaxID=34615 RepID=A0AC60PPZ5_IXOPE|nr:hypothetical protein HPB47_001084 [Ixodes persulcatus]